MDELELLRTIDEARAAAAEEFDLPWKAPEEAMRIVDAQPKVKARMLRRVLRDFHQWFVCRKEEAENAGAEEMRRSEPRNGEVGTPTPSTSTAEPPDLLTWGKTYLPEHFSKPPSAMHRWMAEKLDGMAADRGMKLNVLGPRGGAKSTLATLAYPLREAFHHREPYIWILSDTAEQARVHLENLKAELLDNPLIARDYPQASGRGPVWRAGKIVLHNGVTIESFGTGRADPWAEIPRQPAVALDLRRPPERPPCRIRPPAKPRADLVPRHTAESLYRQFRPDAFGVEGNQYQDLLAPEFEAEFRRQGMLGIQPWLLDNDTNKRVRIRRLGPLLAGRRLRMKADCPSTKLLVSQLQEFPVAEHDDGPDALEMAIRLAEEMLAGVPDDGLGSRLPVG